MMSNQPNPPTKDLFHEKIVYRYLKKLIEHGNANKSDEFHILNPKEVKQIHIVKRNALLLSALAGTSGVLLLYLPYYFFESYFWSVNLPLPYLGPTPIPIGFGLYGLVLAIIEISFLVMINLHSVHRIALICGFPPMHDPDYERHVRTLFEVALEKPDKEILIFGINPHEGLNKFTIFTYTTLNLLKATLSNLIIKFIVARVLGRFAIRAYVDIIGIPIFACWNMYTAHRVIREAKIRIMAPSLIHNLTESLREDLASNHNFIETLYEALQFIAVTKRQFHHNHFLLVSRLFEAFPIAIENKKTLSRDELIAKAQNLDQNALQGLAKLLIFGILIDGHLSLREKKVLDELNRQSLIHVDFATLKRWERSFINGQGLSELTEAKIV
ncbi:MAG: hypothetical protein AAFU64_10085 [Bacteroidota bacterium]